MSDNGHHDREQLAHEVEEFLVGIMDARQAILQLELAALAFVQLPFVGAVTVGLMPDANDDYPLISAWHCRNEECDVELHMSVEFKGREQAYPDEKVEQMLETIEEEMGDV